MLNKNYDKIAQVSNSWTFREARKVAERYKNADGSYSLPSNQKFVVFESGFGPSGIPHIGTYLETTRASMVKNAFQLLTGLPAKLIVIADDLDALRKIPKGLPNSVQLEPWIGFPLNKVPDPFCRHSSYADSMTLLLKELIDRFGIEYELVKSSDAYNTGAYNEIIKKILQNFEAVSEIVKKGIGEVRRQSYSPIMPISPYSGKVIEHCKVVAINLEDSTVSYIIPSDLLIQKRGLDYSISAREYYPEEPLDEVFTVSALNGASKLQWKIDWPARLIARQVAYEMHGQDLNQAAQVAKEICDLFGEPFPVLFQHGLILGKDNKKISKSRGDNFSIYQAINYTPPEVWLNYAHRRPFAQQKFYREIIQIASDRYIDSLDKFYSQSPSERANNSVFHAHNGSVPLKVPTQNFSRLVRIISNFSPVDNERLKEIVTASLPHAQGDNFLGLMLEGAFKYYEDNILINKKYYEPTKEERFKLRVLANRLQQLPKDLSPNDIQKAFFDIGKQQGYSDDITLWFKLIYTSLLGQERGPRASSLVRVYGKELLAQMLLEVASDKEVVISRSEDISHREPKQLYIDNATNIAYPTSKEFQDLVRTPHCYSQAREHSVHAIILERLFSGKIDLPREQWARYLDEIVSNGGKDYKISSIKRSHQPSLITFLAGQSSGKSTLSEILVEKGIIDFPNTIFVSTGFFLNCFPETSAGLTKDQKESGIPRIRSELLHLQRLVTQIALANKVSVVLDIHIIEDEQAAKICDIARLHNVESVLVSPYISMQTYCARVAARYETERRLPFKSEHILFHQILSHNFRNHFRFLFDSTIVVDNNNSLDETEGPYFPVIYTSRKDSMGRVVETIIDPYKYKAFLAKCYIDPTTVQSQIQFLLEQSGESGEQKLQNIRRYLSNIDREIINKQRAYEEGLQTNNAGADVRGRNYIDEPSQQPKAAKTITSLTLNALQPVLTNDKLLVAADELGFNSWSKTNLSKILVPNIESNKLPGTIITDDSTIIIYAFSKLPETLRESIFSILEGDGYKSDLINTTSEHLVIPRYREVEGKFVNVPYRCQAIARAIDEAEIYTDNKSFRKYAQSRSHIPVQVRRPIDFIEVFDKAKLFADFLEANREKLASSLQTFECYNVVCDEIRRSVDHLRNLDKNREFFESSINGVTTFLPLNQPLYATICFGVVPALMARDVCIRPPTAMHETYQNLDKVLNLNQYFDNLRVSYAPREAFVYERARNSDAVIFTGTPENAAIVRKLFPKETLFILNGSGHNPLVITDTADIKKAVESTLSVALQNQGQDCAGPNAILVHTTILEEFKTSLLLELKKIEPLVGPYSDHKNIVGPNTDPMHALKIARLFSNLKEYCIYGGDINPITGLIRPTVFEKPLESGPNLREFFAPVIMLQPYKNDEDLALYFEDPDYALNAMYVCVFGKSVYVNSLISKGLHTEDNVLHNADLHEVERGFLPYGGMGPAASCLFVNGSRIVGATLPQRDIHQYLVRGVNADKEFIIHKDGYAQQLRQGTGALRERE